MIYIEDHQVSDLLDYPALIDALATAFRTCDEPPARQHYTITGRLFELTRGTCAGRISDEEITLFKSVGSSLEDLAAAVLLASRIN